MKTSIQNLPNLARLVVLVLLSTLIAQPSTSFAQGTAFTYQGRLHDGANPASGIYDLQFALFDAASGGVQQSGTWTQLASTVSNGLFTVTLDFGNFFPGADRWLEMGVRTNGGGGFTTLSPRQKLTATPYAVTAGNVTGPLSAAQLTGTVPSAQLGGTYSGAVTFNNAGSSFTGNGTDLINVNAATLGGLSSANFWRTGGNAGTTPGTQFLGTTDNQPMEFKVKGTRALRLEPTAGTDTVNVIGGSAQNSVGLGLEGATIAGGGIASFPNTITASYATIGGGTFNRVAGGWATIGGGRDNSVAGGHATLAGGLENAIQNNANFATIGGGALNVIQQQSTFSTIGGGRWNLVESNNFSGTIAGGEKNSVSANASYSSISGGLLNSVASEYASLGGGNGNTIQSNAIYATIAGGSGNTIRTDSPRGTVGGGLANTVGAQEGTVAGGAFNNALGFSATIGGGGGNAASGVWSTIAGGRDNALTNAPYATIAGGYLNAIQTSADYATIGGGGGNTIQSDAHFATIPGGRFNSATNYAFAAGNRAKANHTGAFVWADSTDADFASSAANQFSVRANNGVVIQANPNGTALELRTGGAIKVTGAGIGTGTPAFVHRATPANIEAGATHRTTITHPHCDGNPNAILIITHNYNPGLTGGILDVNPTSVFYHPGLAKWQIYHDNFAVMAADNAWNVLVIKP